MARFDATNSLCRIYVKRTGLLSAVGHDLEIGIESYAIDRRGLGPAIDATFAADSLRVIDAVQGGRLRPGTLSAMTRPRSIATWRTTSSRPPTTPPSSSTRTRSSSATGGGYLVRGRLRLHGKERPLHFGVTARASSWSPRSCCISRTSASGPSGPSPARCGSQPELRVRVALAFAPAAPIAAGRSASQKKKPCLVSRQGFGD